jgi:uncharacterized protein DUF4397
MRHNRFLVAGAALLAASAWSSCRSEANRNEPVRTSTEGGTTTAPPASSVSERDASLVRVVQAIPAHTPANVYADDLNAFPNLDYKTVTPYKELRDNEVTFKVELAGQTPPPADKENELLMDGRHYTVVAMPGEKDQPAQLKVLSDEITPPEAGKAKVRVVNASPDAGKVDVMVPGDRDPVLKGIGINDDSGFKEIAPVTGKILVRDEVGKRVVAEVPGPLEAGKIYTVVVVGRKVGTPKTEAVMIKDELTGTAPGTTPASPY